MLKRINPISTTAICRQNYHLVFLGKVPQLKIAVILPSVTFRFGYTGREWDGETEQYYYRARYYDSTNGRFLSIDPIGFTAEDANLYRYVGNNPLNLIDPSGEYGRVSNFSRQITYTKAGKSGTVRSTLDLWQKVVSDPKKKPTDVFRSEKPGFRILTDSVSARIDKDLSQTSNPTRAQTKPIGGILRNTEGVYVTENEGHIIPNELGGSNSSRINPFSNNFFSQNDAVNRGMYRVFGTTSNRFLDYLYKEYDKNKNTLSQSDAQLCQSDNSNQTPYIEMGARLFYKTDGLEGEFPFRPYEFAATSRFHYPRKLIPRNSDLRPTYLLQVMFTNPIGSRGSFSTLSNTLDPDLWKK